MLTGPRALLGLSCVIAISASCSSEPRSGERVKDAPVPKPEVRTVHAPVDIGNVRRDPALAFKRNGNVLFTSSATFDAAITTRGSVVVTPHEASAPLELETISITRGTHVLATGAASTIDATGAVAIARGEVEEKIENDDAALEQSWSFRERPQGEGDLVVRVQATGESFVGTTAHGIHFADLRYGTGTWIDADGKRTEITPQLENGTIVLRVPNDVVTSSRYPAVLDPTVTPEKEIDKPGAPGAALGDRTYPLVASSRSATKGYVAAWYDRRGIRPALYTSRTSTTGAPTADVGNVAVNGVTPSTTPFLAAAPNGGYLLVWSVASYDPFLAPGVYAVRLDDDGVAIDKSPVAVADNQGYIYSLGAAFDGTSWLIAWQRYNSTTYYDISGARLSKDGQRLDQKPLEIAKSTDYEYNPVVVSNGGGGFLVGWRANSAGLQARIVASDGTLTGAGPISVHPSTLISEFRLTSGNNQYAIAWTESGNVFAKRLDAQGTVLDPAPISINVEANFSDSRPRIIWDGTSYVVAFWRSTTPMPSVLAQRLNPSGALIDAAPFSIASSQYLTDVAMASDGSGSILVNREYYGATNVPYRYEIRAWSTTKTNPVPGDLPQTSPPTLLSKGAPAETEPSVVWTGTRHQAAWLDQRDSAMTIYGASMDKDGVASGVKALLTNPSPTNTIYSGLTRPRIAHGTNGFLVVFFATEQVNTTYRRGVFGLVLDGNGNLTGNVRDISVTPTNSPSYIDEREPDVAFDGKNYFVVWQQQTNDGYAIAGRRVDQNGAVVDTKESLRLTAVSSTQLRTTPSVAYDGTSYFVAWVTSRQTTSINVTHIYGSRVNKDDLSPLDGEVAICEKFLLQRSPHVSADPKGGFFVVWEDNRNSLEAADIYASRITPQGAVMDGADGIKVAVGVHDEARPKGVLSGDGTNWVVAWRDLRSKQTYDIYGAWVSRMGKVHDREGFLLSAEGGDEEAPTLTAPQDSKLVLTYQRLDPAAGSYRLRSRAIDGGKLVAAPCTTGDECASRSCVDGVCCESECGACGVCNATPGKCTPKGAGVETPACKNYKCQEGIECPTSCKSDADCSANATCDPTSSTCVSRVICIDSHTLRDLTNKTTDCAPYSCVGDACRTNCGSVDDCAPGFVCNLDSKCVNPPKGDEGGCATGSSGPESNLGWMAVGAFLGLAAVRRRRAAR